MAVKLTADSFESEVLSADGLVVTDFFSDSCIPCKRMSPVIAELEEEHGDVKFAKLNINFDGEIAERYSVTAVPTLIFFQERRGKSTSFGCAEKGGNC